MATISAGASAILIPGVGAAIDLALIKGTIMAYYRQMGLSNTTSEERALLETKYKEIIDRYQSASLKRSIKEFTSTVVTKALVVMIGVEEISKYIPIIGTVIASSVGFAVTLHYLIRCINELEEAAIAVWDNAAKRSIQDGSDASRNNSSTE